ncbi:uncharacterized protein [Primulina huaijiensis]|uniref:uncharacterized protein n=1 Tax=Primulina huaijiensis TaxID=1492673 RepID=UPI003CC75B46
MIFISDVATYALLDSRATHSFISESFVKRLGVLSEIMESRFRVTVPSGEQMLSTSMVKDVELRLQKDIVRADLIVLSMPEKLMRRDCQGFLASFISASDTVSQSIEDVEVFSDFPNIFPNDVSGILSEKEVEFFTELMSGTVPISKAPYHLAPTEIKGLKDQIQELLEKRTP